MMLRHSLILVALVFLVTTPHHPATAQVFSDTPLCLKIFNSNDNEVLGHIETAEYRDASGNLSWHRNNFTLKSQETREVCSTGPFFDGFKLRIVLKTIIPLYSCKADMGTTVTISTREGSHGFNELVADCPSENVKLGQ